jgi:signal transduction histidine kinase
MSTAHSVRTRVLASAERYVPRATIELEVELGLAHRARNAIVISRVGVVATAVTALMFAYLGSPWSGVAIGSILIPLLSAPFAVRRSVPLSTVANVTTGITWVVTFVVAARTGGFASPALMWAFFHPITTYVVCGRRTATVWSALGVGQIMSFYVAERAGAVATQDLAPSTADLLRMVGFVGCILTLIALIAAIEGVRAASQAQVDDARRLIERQRILGDMHDGVGGQLLGMMVQARAGQLDDEQLVNGLTSCLDDLRLIVDSLDPVERPFDVAVAELRARLEPRCTAAGVTLTWTVHAPTRPLGPDAMLQVLRALQEMTTNALRHSGTASIDVTMRPHGIAAYEVAVRDHGVGFDPENPARSGRGLPSLQARARRLGGRLSLERCRPGMRVALVFETPPG